MKNASKKIVSIILLVSLMATLFIGCSKNEQVQTSKQGSGSKKVLKLSHPAGTEHTYHKAALMFKGEVEKRTNGSIEIEIFPANQLGKQSEVVEGLQLGTVDMAIAADDQYTTIVPEFGALGMPFLFKDTDDVYEKLNGEVGDMLAKKLESKNVIIISWLENGFRHITNNRQPIYVPSDLDGIKIRTSSSKPNMMSFNTFGANATNISFSELYNALQMKVVDAQENPTTNIIDKKFYEVQDYLSISGHVHTSEPMAMSKKAFDELTPEEQAIFQEVGKEVSKFAFDKVKSDFEEQVEQLKGLMEVNEVDRDAFVEAVQPVYDEYYDRYKEVIDMIRE